MKTKSEKFPLNIRNGSSVVKIYRDKTKASGIYSPAKKGEDATGFDMFAAAIRRHGYDKKFYSRTFRYFDFDGFTYWDCDAPNVKADLINRCPYDPRQPAWPKLPPDNHIGEDLLNENLWMT